MNMRRGSQKFDDSQHQRDKTGKFTKMANSGPPSAAEGHQVDLAAPPPAYRISQWNGPATYEFRIGADGPEGALPKGCNWFEDTRDLVWDTDRDVSMLVDSEHDFSVTLGGKGEGAVFRYGSGNGNAYRVGPGDGGALRDGSGDGNAVRGGSGDGNAVRGGSGHGDAIIDNMSTGWAERMGSGHGDAIHRGSGDGEAVHDGTGGGKAITERQSKPALRYRHTPAEQGHRA